MGTDNLHHPRKERLTASLRRQSAKRKPYDLVLIVCEGSKTEPYYFEQLRDDLKLSTANIEIVGYGVDPLTLVTRAIKIDKQSRYDHIYCVFDKDIHPSYPEALQKINKTPRFHAIHSVPCFEYWLLLHFIYTTQPFHSSGNLSVCEIVIKSLKKYLPNYDKTDELIFEKIKDQMDLAIQRARAVEQYHQEHATGTDNPSTRVYKLVEYLRNLKK